MLFENRTNNKNRFPHNNNIWALKKCCPARRQPKRLVLARSKGQLFCLLVRATACDTRSLLMHQIYRGYCLFFLSFRSFLGIHSFSCTHWQARLILLPDRLLFPPSALVVQTLSWSGWCGCCCDDRLRHLCRSAHYSS